MTLFFSMKPTEVRVEPGQEAECALKIRNTGSVIDQFTLEPIGDVGEWVHVEPKIVNLFPDTEVTARLVFRPPKTSEVRAGDLPFGIRVSSRESPLSSIVEEGTVTVGSFTKISAEFVPKGSRGSRRGRHRLAIDNEGNTPTAVDVTLIDPESRLNFHIRERSWVTEPGTATLIEVKAIPKKRFLKGPNQTHPFQATITGDSFKPETADAAMVQEQLLPSWLPKFLFVLIAFLIAGAILWLTLLRPVVKSAAREAAEAETGELSQNVAQASQQAANANQNAAAALTAVGGTPSPIATPSAGQGGDTAGGDDTGEGGTSSSGNAGGTQGGATAGSGSGTNNDGPTTGTGTVGGGSGTGQAAPAASTPVDFTMRTSTPAGNGGTFKTFSYTAPPGKTLLISDFVLANPQGDAGLLEIRRGNVTLLPFGLDNFRSFDQHFLEPIRVPPGQPIILAVNCQNESRACTPSAYFSGRLQ